MKKKRDSIFKQIINKINPSHDLKKIEPILKTFLEKLKQQIKKQKISAEIFLGGSYAKGTVIKKDKYDIDVFIRFDKKYKDKEIAQLTEKILKHLGEKYMLVHGSRDYFKINVGSDFYFEIIPVKKITKPKQAENITDLSYLHVKYVKTKLKTKKLVDEIRLLKSFCYANKCYGAESYINGFSGYALELLIIYYGSFLKFAKEAARAKPKQKIIIDPARHYRNKQQAMMDINSSKLQSPIILIDPTFKQRNALAALSNETFEKFKQVCKDFLRAPNAEVFELEKTDLDAIETSAKKNKQEFILLEATTGKQEGDVAGSKLFKFYNFLIKEIQKYFDIKNKGFNYNEKKAGRYYFVCKAKKEILISGPRLEQREHVKAFEKAHPNYSIKAGKLRAREKVDFSLKTFIESWKKKHAKQMKEMSVGSLGVV